jgi:hypothetical protein
MKSTFAFLALLSLVVEPYSFGQAPVAPLTETNTVTITQATTAFQLEHTEKEPIYTTQQVPDTCYRDVQQGTRQDCETLNNHQCTTQMVNECNNVAYPVCQTVAQNVCNPVSYPVCQNITRSVCSPVSNQVCQNEPRQVCQSVPRSQCDPVQQCTQVNDQVCHGQGASQVCQTVPRSQCTTVTQCHQVSDSVCHTENQNVCHTETTQSCHDVADQVCHSETRQDCHVENQNQCHDEYRQECANVPEQSCTDTPYQSCSTVPNMVSTPYACTRPVQVQIGEQVKLHNLAQVSIILQSYGQVDVSHDQLTATLDGNDVSLKLTQSSGTVIFHVLKKDQQVQTVSATDNKIVTTFTLDAISLAALSQLSQVKIVNPVLNFDKLLFNIAGADLTRIPVTLDSGHLQILMRKNVFLGHRMVTIIDNDFAATDVKQVGGQYEIDFSTFNAGPLESKSHDVAISVGVKTTFDPAELLNPEILNQVSLAPLTTSFTGFPVQ